MFFFLYKKLTSSLYVVLLIQQMEPQTIPDLNIFFRHPRVMMHINKIEGNCGYVRSIGKLNRQETLLTILFFVVVIITDSLNCSTAAKSPFSYAYPPLVVGFSPYYFHTVYSSHHLIFGLTLDLFTVPIS